MGGPCCVAHLLIADIPCRSIRLILTLLTALGRHGWSMAGDIAAMSKVGDTEARRRPLTMSRLTHTTSCLLPSPTLHPHRCFLQ